MKQFDTSQEGPLNDLALAINHYVSTGDHIGEGVAMEDAGGNYIVQIAYDPKNPDDADDYRRFEQRVKEIIKDGTVPVTMTDGGQQNQFRVSLLHVRPADVRRLAAELVRSCGVAGWGTPKLLIDNICRKCAASCSVRRVCR